MAIIQLIRNATIKVKLGQRTLLIDPMLGEKGAFESYGGIQNNPIIDLPFSAKEVLEGVDAVLLTHLHKDHFDDFARELIPKNTPIYCQPGDYENITESGFSDVREVIDVLGYEEIEIFRTDGNHGRGSIEKMMGQVSGYVLKSPKEPDIYVVGDCVFNEKVKNAIDTHQPEIIITNSGGAFIPGYEDNLILLDEKETLELTDYAKNSKVITVHLEALDHCTVSRASMRRAVLLSNIDHSRIMIPNDGEIMTFDT